MTTCAPLRSAYAVVRFANAHVKDVMTPRPRLSTIPRSASAACHSPEGDNVRRSLECVLIHEADVAWWKIAAGFPEITSS